MPTYLRPENDDIQPIIKQIEGLKSDLQNVKNPSSTDAINEAIKNKESVLAEYKRSLDILRQRGEI